MYVCVSVVPPPPHLKECAYVGYVIASTVPPSLQSESFIVLYDFMCVGWGIE